MKNLKNFNLRVLTMLLTAGFAISSPMVVHAEEEEEILYIQEEDEHEQEDLTDETKNDMIEAAENAEQENGQENAGQENSGEENGQENSGAETGTEAGSENEKEDSEEDKKDYGDDEFIDDENWSPEQDSDPNAGKEIPDTVKTEWERKHPKTTPPGTTPPGDTPKEETQPEQQAYQPEQQQQQTTPSLVEQPKPAPKTGDTGLKWFLGGAGLFGIGLAAYKIFLVSNDALVLHDLQNGKDPEEYDENPIKIVKAKKSKKSKKGNSKIKILRRN